MRRRLLIFCSLIGVILAFCSLPIYAEDAADPVAQSPTISIPDYALDSYFYDNYDLLPYIQSDGSQYINTGINISSDISYEFSFSYDEYTGGTAMIGSFVSSLKRYQLYMSSSFEGLTLTFNAESGYFTYDTDNYGYYTVSSDGLNTYVNGELVGTFNNSYSVDVPLYIFARNNNGNAANYSSFKLYRFLIKDNESDEYLKYYYPAKTKASGVIGLYDSISKTFVTTSGSVPFASPTDDNVMNFQISDFLDAALGWIGDIFVAIIDMPLIIMFIAIGFAGVAFRWARRIVHF